MWIKISSLVMFFGVAAGAFGAHGLKNRLDESSLAIWHTATLYLFVHGLALLMLSFISRTDPTLPDRLSPTMVCFLLGIVVFSGSLYGLALSGVKILGAITPIGGLLFLVGWILLFFRAGSVTF